jgi:hypothetical protein
MVTLPIHQLERALKQYQSENIKMIKVGYKLYAQLMSDLDFVNEVMNSALRQDHRKFRGIPLKVSQADYDFKLITANEKIINIALES